MNRAVRTARGAFAALATTLLAAASHGIADGVITPLSVVATVLLALPLCVMLAGKVGSLWRLSLAVVPAQFVYHWSFAGLGTATLSASDGGLVVSPHAAHLGMISASFPSITTLTSEVAAAGAAETLMWASHAVSAVATIALLHRGERAAIHLMQVLRNTMPVVLPLTVQVPSRPAIRTPYRAPAEPARQIFLSVISHRGPPIAACTH